MGQVVQLRELSGLTVPGDGLRAGSDVRLMWRMAGLVLSVGEG